MLLQPLVWFNNYLSVSSRETKQKKCIKAHSEFTLKSLKNTITLDIELLARYRLSHLSTFLPALLSGLGRLAKQLSIQVAALVWRILKW